MSKTIKRTTGIKVAFGDVVHLSKERSKDPEADGFERYIGLEHLESSELKVRSWGDLADGVTFTNVFRPGQVLFGKRRAYQRKVAVADFSGVCSGDIYVLEPNGEQLLPELLPFICQSEPFYDYVISMSQGGLSPRVNWKTLAKYEFALPPLVEQRRIAEVLQAADRHVMAMQRLLERYGCLYESFLDYTWHCCVSDGKSCTIDQICDEVTVGIVITPSKYFAESGVPAISHSNIHLGRIDLNGVDLIGFDAHQELRKTWLYKGDVVLPRVSTIAGKPYYAAQVPEELDEINSIGIVILRPDRTTVQPGYLEAALNAPSMRRRLVGVAVGSIQRQLNVSIIKRERVPVVHRKRQEQIASHSGQIKSGLEDAKQRLAQSRDIRQRLLQEVLGS